MLLVVKKWLENQLGISLGETPDRFLQSAKDGTIIAKILRKFHQISSEDLQQITETTDSAIAYDNFNNFIRPWLSSIGINLSDSEVYEITHGDSTTVFTIFYELYITLEGGLPIKSVDHIRQKKHTFTLTKVPDNSLDKVAIEANPLCEPLIKQWDVINWEKDHLAALMMKYAKAKEDYEQYLEHKKSKEFEVQDTYNDDELALTTERDKSDYTYEELVDLQNRALLAEPFIPDPTIAQKIVRKFKKKTKERMKLNALRLKMQQEAAANALNRMKTEEEKEFDKLVVQKLLKQSAYEKEIAEKLFNIRQQKNIIIENKRKAEEEEQKRRDEEFVRRLFEEELEERLKFHQEREELLEEHRILYEEKQKLKARKHEKVVMDVINDIVELAIKTAEYKKTYGAEPPIYIQREWGNLFIKQEPMLEHLPLPDFRRCCYEEVPPELEKIFKKEMKRQHVLDEQDLSDYVNFRNCWIIEEGDFEEEILRLMQLGMNVLGYIVHRLLLRKYPLPLPEKPNLSSEIETSVCVTDIEDLSKMGYLQRLLDLRNVKVIYMEEATNFCVKCYEDEKKTEIDDPLPDDLDDNLKEIAPRERGGKGKKDKKGKGAKGKGKGKDKKSKDSKKGKKGKKGGDDAPPPAPTTEEKQAQTPRLFPWEKVVLSNKARLGKMAKAEVELGNALEDKLLVEMFVEYLMSFKDIKGWVLVNYPNNYEQAALLEQALSGKPVPGEYYAKNINKESLESVQIVELEPEEEEVTVSSYSSLKECSIASAPLMKTPSKVSSQEDVGIETAIAQMVDAIVYAAEDISTSNHNKRASLNSEKVKKDPSFKTEEDSGTEEVDSPETVSAEPSQTQRNIHMERVSKLLPDLVSLAYSEDENSLIPSEDIEADAATCACVNYRKPKSEVCPCKHASTESMETLAEGVAMTTEQQIITIERETVHTKDRIVTREVDVIKKKSETVKQDGTVVYLQEITETDQKLNKTNQETLGVTTELIHKIEDTVQTDGAIVQTMEHREHDHTIVQNREGVTMTDEETFLKSENLLQPEEALEKEEITGNEPTVEGEATEIQTDLKEESDDKPQEHVLAVDNFEDRRLSKIVPNTRPIEKEIYQTLLTAYIKTKPKDEGEEEEEIPCWKDKYDGLEKFYCDQGCYYLLEYEEFNSDTVKCLAKTIIGDYSLPLKSSLEIFGERYLQAQFEVGDNVVTKKGKGKKDKKKKKGGKAKSEAKIKKGKGSKKDKASKKSKGSKKSGKKDKKGKKGKKGKEPPPPPPTFEDKEVQFPMVEEEEELLPEPKAGEPDWEYINIPIPLEIELTVATLWDNMEQSYVRDFKELFFNKRLLLNEFGPYIGTMKQSLYEFIERPDPKQYYLREFQKTLNEIDLQLRSDQDTKDELLCRIEEFKDKLVSITDNKMTESEEERTQFIRKNWIFKQFCEYINNCCHAFQLEIDRFVDSVQVVTNYYYGIITKELKEIPLHKEILERLECNKEASEEINVMLVECNEEDINTSTQFHKYIEENYNICNEFVKIMKPTAFKPVEDAKKLFLVPAKEKKKPKKKGKNAPKPFEPDEDVKENSDRIFEEWECAVNGEISRCFVHLYLIKKEMLKKFEDVIKWIKQVMRVIFETISTRYQNEMISVQRACELLSRSVEEEKIIQPELTFEGDKLAAIKIALFPDVEDKPDYSDGKFRLEQLDYVVNVLMDIAPDGLIMKQTFLFLLQDIAYLDDIEGEEIMTPQVWRNLSSTTLKHLLERLFDDNEYLYWKDFIVCNFMVPFPTSEQLMEIRNKFRMFDEELKELVSREEFFSVDFWFETEQFFKINLFKMILFKMYRTDEETINYTAMLLDFCKDENPMVGFARALELSLGRFMCYDNDTGEEFVADVLKERKIHDECMKEMQEEHDDTVCLAKKAVSLLVDQIVHQCESATITEIPPEDPEDKTPSPNESRQGFMLEDKFSDKEVGFETRNNTHLCHFLPLELIVTIVVIAVPWYSRVEEPEELTFLDKVVQMYEECRNESFNNAVLVHEFINNERVRELFKLTTKFSANNPVKVIKELVEADKKTSPMEIFGETEMVFPG